jgi:hypothetical protein
VLVCAGANWFRGGDWAGTLENLQKITLNDSKTSRTGIKTQEDLDYAFKLQSQLKKLKDITVRVETPWISVYSNNKAEIDSLIKLDRARVKYISVPPSNNTLTEGVIISPKVNYEFKVTMGKSGTQQSAFVSWAESNPKVKLTKSCKKELSRDRSWGGSYFYITGEKNLLLAKMHLGGSINKIERIVKG